MLLTTCQQGLQYPGQQLLEGSLMQGESFRASAVRLLRLAHRFLSEDDPEVLRRQAVLEVILGVLPKEVASYVRERETTDLFTAMDLASKYFKREGWDEFRFDSNKPWTYPNYSKKVDKERDGRYGDYHKRGRSKYYSREESAADRKTEIAADKQSDKSSGGSHVRYVTNSTQGVNGAPWSKYKQDKPQYSVTKGGNKQEGCWDCKESGHDRAYCPKRVPRTQANTVKVTCLSLATPEPYTVPGSIGETPVERMLIDTGADMSLVVEDLVPPGTQMSKSVWVEGVGAQLQLYQTAKLPVTIMGKKTELLAAIAPIHHIPFAVVLGRNVPGLKHTWTMEITDNTSDGGEGQDTGGAGEWASQVVLESADIPVPGPQNPPAPDITVSKHTTEKEIKTTAKSVSFADMERQDRQHERMASKLLTTQGDDLKYSQPSMEMQQLSVMEPGFQDTGTVPEDTGPGVYEDVEPNDQEDTDNIATVVAMVVETRRQKWKKDQEEAVNAQATANSGVHLTPLGGEQKVQKRIVAHDGENTAVHGGDTLSSDAQEGTSAESQPPLPLTASTGEAGAIFTSTDQSKATPPEQAMSSKNMKRTNTKQAKKTAAVERSKPTMEISREVLKRLQLADQELGPVLREEIDGPALYSIEDGIVFATDRTKGQEDGKSAHKLVVVPQALRDPVLYAAHEAAGHFGSHKTKKLLAGEFYWPKMGKDVTAYCKSCPVCLQWNSTKEPKPPLRPLPVVPTPWTKVALDIVGPLPLTSEGYRYLLTLVDFGTRFPEAIPLKKVDAKSTCQALLQIFSCFGVPEEILTDNGTNFVAAVTEELLKHLQCTHIKSSPYHPQSNGMVERLNGVLKKTIDKIASGKSGKEWKQYLPAVLMALRNIPHTALGVSPYHLMFGREARSPVAALRATLTDQHPLPLNILTYLDNLYKEMEDMEKVVQKEDQKSKDASKTYYDQGAKDDPLVIGDEVLCMLPAGESGLTAKWEGPYQVQEVLGPLTYLIDKPTKGRKGRKVHRNHLKRYIYHVNLAHIITAEEDNKKLDGLTLGPQIPLKGQEPDPDRWTKAVDVDGLTVEQKEDLLQLLPEFEDTFSDFPGEARLPPFQIDTGQKGPTTSKPYTVPLAFWDKMKDELKNMEALGIITPSVSNWSCPVICVAKPNGGIRLCMDYRKLNKITAQDVYPLPNIEHLIQKVSKANYITTMDLTKGYYQVPLADSDQHKTAFVTAMGKWQFTKMPFGIQNAPAWFQRHMDHLLRDQERADAYIDDVCVYSGTWNEHLQDVWKTLECLHDVGLTVKLEKCSFGQAKVKYLGHIIGGGKVAPVQAKVQAIMELEPPVNKKGMRRFLGMASYYRRFVRNFAEMAAPLHKTTAKKAPTKICWNTTLTTAFNRVKTSLGQATELYAPDYHRSYTLKTDASGTGIGAALEQEKDGMSYPIAFFSRKLTDTERRYSASELETLAIIDAINHFGVYLKGSAFTVETDHKALTFIQTLKRGSPKLLRWAAVLQEYDCAIVYRPGPTNVVADALSRAFEAPDEDQAQQSDLVKRLEMQNSLPASPEVGGDVGTQTQP